MYGNNLSIEADLNRHFSRYEDPLYDLNEDEERKTMIRVIKKETKTTCIFNVIKNNELIYCIDCKKLTKKQANYLKSVEGMQFIIEQLKNNVKNISNLKAALKKVSV